LEEALEEGALLATAVYTLYLSSLREDSVTFYDLKNSSTSYSITAYLDLEFLARS
jgi:hypothetical protein